MLFIQSEVFAPTVQCSISAATLDHRDSFMSVMKFLKTLLASPYNKEVSLIVNCAQVDVLQCAVCFAFCLKTLSKLIKFIESSNISTKLHHVLANYPISKSQLVFTPVCLFVCLYVIVVRI